MAKARNPLVRAILAVRGKSNTQVPAKQKQTNGGMLGQAKQDIQTRTQKINQAVKKSTGGK